MFKWINNITSLCVIGRRGSGKTALVYSVLEKYTKKVYVFKNPQEKEVKSLGYHILYNISDIERLQECLVWIDEPQLFIKYYDKKTNFALLNMLSIARHRGITLVLSTSDTRFVNKSMESYIDVWLIKDIETELIKRGSIVKKIIRNNCLIDEEGFRLKVDEFLFYSRDYDNLSGRHNFKKPEYFTETLSKPFKSNCETNCEPNCETNCEPKCE